MIFVDVYHILQGFFNLSKMEETWKDIEGYEGLYQVSTFGRIKSNYMINHKWNNYISKNKSRILSGGKRKGYINIKLYRDKIVKSFPVHRLVAMAFIPNPENKPQVNHRDLNRSNNHISNLEWNTNKENCVHGVANNINRVIHKGVAHKLSKLTENDILEIRYLVSLGIPKSEIASKYSISNTHVNGIYKRTSWSQT